MGEDKKKLKLNSKMADLKKKKKHKKSLEKNSGELMEDGGKVRSLRKKRPHTKIKKNCEDKQANHIDGEGKSKKVRKVKKDRLLSQNKDLLEDNEAKQDGVYEISSGDEDCSKGMKKWIIDCHQCRPGVKVLQERIDDFIISHEAQKEQEREEREALAAEGGWTVVVHHKGRKKTTDTESGTAVGAAHAAVTDRVSKKKNKEVGLDFYRFQKREAKRSEIMMLQSKFEQDKKRIQQMRATRKFKPY